MKRSTVADRLDALTRPGEVYEKLEDDMVQCHACAHNCRIPSGRRGVCQMRFNRKGELFVPWGYVAGLQPDPIEKKPYFHFLPGSDTLTFGMLGCNFHCGFCQNWLSSQTLREPASDRAASYIEEITPEEIVAIARRRGINIIASSYNEPLITSEWALEIFKLAKAQGMKCVYVSNGFATPQVMEYLHPYLDGFKMDLKAMQDVTYRSLGGRLQPVLDSIRLGYEMGFWVEVVTLIVPELNDSPAELRKIAGFLASVSPDIPWHVTAFHPDFKMTDGGHTPASSLLQAARIAEEEGLRYVYAGNLPGRVGSLENTYCPNCKGILIERSGYRLQQYRITAQGACPDCGEKIAGRWTEKPEAVQKRGWEFGG